MPLKFHPYEYDFAAQDAQRVARLGANVTAWPADEVHAAICAVKNIPVIELEFSQVDLALLGRLSKVFSRVQALPTFSRGLVCCVAMVRPWDPSILVTLRQETHQEVTIVAVRLENFERLLGRCASAVRERNLRLRQDAAAKVHRVVERPERWEFRGRPHKAVVEEIISLAASLGASDIILNPSENCLDVRLKHSGETEVLPPVEPAFAPLLIRGFKELSGMSTRDTHTIQDGQAEISIAGKVYELRLSTAPTKFGESLVARLQNREAQEARMAKLPFDNPKHLRLVEMALRQKAGLFITTGPVNSGKSTLMYSCLRHLDTSRLHIRTLEDPPEMTIPWVAQIPITSSSHDESDRSTPTFQNGLRALLRQSSDVILLGEIRSPDVCATAIEAVLSGHFILSTIHSMDAIGVIPRMLNHGVSGHNLAQSLLIVVGQRLLPQLCPHCRAEIPLSDTVKRHFELYQMQAPDKIFEKRGCPRCDSTGILGRVPIFEIMVPNDEMKEIIAEASDAHFRRRALQESWFASGGETLGKHAMTRVAAGEIDYGEAERHDAWAFHQLVANATKKAT